MKTENKKIIVLGCPGSGKSTFSKRLHALTQVPLYHLDQIWWKPDRTNISRDEFDERLKEILDKDEWIIDGSYSRTYEPRIRACDTIIILDLDEEVCMEGIRKRVGIVRSDIPWTEEELDPELLKQVKKYKSEDRVKLMDLLKKYPDRKVIMFKTREEAEAYLDSLSDHSFFSLREKPELKEAAAEWFHQKWGVEKEAYLECMDTYLDQETEYGWYLCTEGDRIISGLGVIDNDFHDRKDLSPNICAVYTEKEYRGMGIAGRLLNLAVEDLRAKGITPVYLVTDHKGFYERYGWEFFCMVQGDGEPDQSRLYIHR